MSCRISAPPEGVRGASLGIVSVLLFDIIACPWYRLMDDVDASSIDMALFMRTFRNLKLDVGAAAVMDSQLPGMRPTEHCIKRDTDQMSMRFIVFSTSAFACWQRLLEQSAAPIEWAINESFRVGCNASMGVLDQHHVRLHERGSSSPLTPWPRRARAGRPTPRHCCPRAVPTRPMHFLLALAG